MACILLAFFFLGGGGRDMRTSVGVGASGMGMRMGLKERKEGRYGKTGFPGMSLVVENGCKYREANGARE